MKSFPRRSFLYRTMLSAVILLAAIGATQFGWSQYARKSRVSKGPRAIGLIQLQSNGKARLIPVAIMIDGKFYDAGSYKADPVPMALDFETVYEGFRTGVSQGLMTITQPGHLKTTWIAEGTWLPAGARPASARKKAEVPSIEEKDEPPKLHRGSDKSAATPSDKTTGTSSSDKPSTSDHQKPGGTPAAATAKAEQKKTTQVAASKSPSNDESVDLSRPIDDPNRPVLRRGKPDPTVRRERMKDFDEEASSGSAKSQPASEPKDNMLAKLIPAISDAGGPDSHSYSYDTKPTEEAAFQEKMLDLASAELRRTNPAYAESTVASKSARKSSSVGRSVHKSAGPSRIAFTDVQLHIFDLSSSNEPILVLSAKAPAPSSARKPSVETQLAASQSTSGVTPLPQEITLVAKTNLEGELRKMFFSATDAEHLDVAPRMELIDAVDADGDGRGELLFRRTSDAGSSYAIYRAAADQLWPLYEGTP